VKRSYNNKKEILREKKLETNNSDKKFESLILAQDERWRHA
jgi:hypothetical protein